MTAVDIGAGRKKKEDVIDHSAGFVFHKKVGDSVKKGEPVLTIHTNNESSVNGAMDRLKRVISISGNRSPAPKMILYLVDKNGIKEWGKW